LNNDTSTRILPFNAWIFGFIWVCLHVVCFFVLDYLLFKVLFDLGLVGQIETWSFRFFVYFFLLAILRGFVFGIVEWYLLQRHFEWPLTWIAATIVGFLLLDLRIYLLAEFTVPSGSSNYFLNPIFYGPILGNGLYAGAQWFVLRKEVSYAWLWIIVSMLSWIVAIYASYIIGLLFFAELMIWYGEIGRFIRFIVMETIKVSCLIWLLYVTLKQDKGTVETAIE
jgi:hypothetical protein